LLNLQLNKKHDTSPVKFYRDNCKLSHISSGIADAAQYGLFFVKKGFTFCKGETFTIQKSLIACFNFTPTKLSAMLSTSFVCSLIKNNKYSNQPTVCLDAAGRQGWQVTK